MAPHMITHCINDHTSFLRESRQLNSYHILPKTIEFYLYIQVPNVTSKMYVGLILAGPPCM